MPAASKLSVSGLAFLGLLHSAGATQVAASASAHRGLHRLEVDSAPQDGAAVDNSVDQTHNFVEASGDASDVDATDAKTKTLAAKKKAKKPAISKAATKQLKAVTEVLKDIQSSITSAETTEKANYAKFAKWCTDEKATVAAALTEAKDQAENVDVQGKALDAGIKHAQKDLVEIGTTVQETNDIVAKAQTIRNQENTQYNDDMATNRQSIDQVAKAIKIVGKVHGQGGFLQHGVMQHLQLNEPGESSYVSGIMKGIKKKLDSTRVELQKQEKQRKKEHDAFVAAKKAELASLTQETSDKNTKITESQIQQVDIKRLGKQASSMIKELTARQKHSADMCAAKAKAFKIRSADRVQEKKAIQEALDFLKKSKATTALQVPPDEDDEVSGELEEEEERDTQAVFLQLASARKAAHRAAIMNEEDSDEGESKPGFASFVASFADGKPKSFKGAKAMVTTLIKRLNKQQSDEKDKLDYCNSEIQDKNEEKEETQNDIKELVATIKYKTAEIATLTTEAASMEEKIVKMAATLAKLTTIRKKEKAEYDKDKADRALAMKVLQQATQVIREFYKSQDKTALVEDEAKPSPKKGKTLKRLKALKKAKSVAAPKTFSAGSTRSDIRGNTVVQMMEKVGAEILQEDKEALKDETRAIKDYQTVKKETRQSTDETREDITERVKRKAKLTVQLNTDKENKAEKDKDLQVILGQLKSFHKECDELLKNFEKRTKDRTFETSQLKDVIDILSGASAAVRTGLLEQPGGAMSSHEAALMRDMAN